MKRRLASTALTVAAGIAVFTYVATMAPAQAPADAAPAKAKKQQQKGPQGPTPRLSNGKPDLGGVWRPGDVFLVEDISLALAKGETIPLNDWSKKEMAKHLSKDDPETNCLPTGVPRQAPYPWRFVFHPDPIAPTHLFMLFEGNIHSFRQVFMDGRPHPKDPDPTWFGHSTGKWEGDTLVIDTVGFNDKFWFDFVGHPHSEQLHTIERYTRTDLGMMKEDIEIDDPGAYTSKFTLHSSHRFMPNEEIMEYICQENQRDTQHLVGPAGRP